MCDPVTLGVAAAAAAAGGYINRKSQLDNATAAANARNNVLSQTIGGLDKIYNTNNAPAFAGAVGSVDINKLPEAQAERTAEIEANLPGASSPGSYGGASDAPPAVNAARAAALSRAFNFAKTGAENTGRLGGYTDQWFKSNLAGQGASRKIGLGNANAENLKALLPGQQDLAQAASYSPPSVWGPILTGAGSVLGSAAGGGANPNNLQLGRAFMPAGALSGGLT